MPETPPCTSLCAEKNDTRAWKNSVLPFDNKTFSETFDFSENTVETMEFPKGKFASEAKTMMQPQKELSPYSVAQCSCLILLEFGSAVY